MKILYFIGSLRSGGKERRLIELLTYLKQKGGYKLMVVLAYDQIDYPAFYALGIDCIVLNKKPAFKDPKIFFDLNNICKKYRPDIIHTWGSMQSFYMIPTSVIKKIPIVNSQITSATPNYTKIGFSGLINSINFYFSKIVTSNSKAGLSSLGYKESIKYRIIYNGINLERFSDLPAEKCVKKAFKIRTKFTVVMVASFSDNKDYDSYIDICQCVGKNRGDITFLAVGAGKYLKSMQAKAKNQKIDNILFLGKINNVEEVVSACDIGMLLSNKSVHGEGISNSIMEYMALGKPVIANDAGGTREIISDNVNGYLITNETSKKVANLIIELVENLDKRKKMGNNGKKLIEEKFNLQGMGMKFEKIYEELVILN